MSTELATSLIIIRGNSGSGKSTLAKELRLRMVTAGMKTALVEQDYLRRIVLKEKWNVGDDNIDLIEQTASFALGRGYSVVLEGILYFSRYGEMLERLTKLADRGFTYYLDVPFEETLRRHAGKPNAHEFGEAEMRQWWREHDITRFPMERVIGPESSLEDSLASILGNIGL